MLHLAQINKNPLSGEIELQLLAQKKSDQIWQLSKQFCIIAKNNNCLVEGLLVLVELNENQEILKIESAKDWILNIIENHLSEKNITAEFVEKEQARIEQWRQEITAQSLDLTRRHLEIETRRDQLQELEISLKEEKEKLEIRRQQLEKLQESLQKEKECPQNYQE